MIGDDAIHGEAAYVFGPSDAHASLLNGDLVGDGRLSTLISPFATVSRALDRRVCILNVSRSFDVGSRCNRFSKSGSMRCHVTGGGVQR